MAGRVLAFLVMAGLVALPGCTNVPTPGKFGGATNVTDSAAPENLTIETLGSCDGRLSNYRAEQLTTRESFLAFWREACRDGERRPFEVDFERQAVLAVFLGIRPTTGFTVEVSKAVRTAEKIEILSVEMIPGPRCAVGAANTYPNVFAAVNKTGLRPEFAVEGKERPCA